jgi:hypothetical protein
LGTKKTNPPPEEKKNLTTRSRSFSEVLQGSKVCVYIYTYIKLKKRYSLIPEMKVVDQVCTSHYTMDHI